jgi:hypothetical protein
MAAVSQNCLGLITFAWVRFLAPVLLGGNVIMEDFSTLAPFAGDSPYGDSPPRRTKTDAGLQANCRLLLTDFIQKLKV